MKSSHALSVKPAILSLSVVTAAFLRVPSDHWLIETQQNMEFKRASIAV